MKSKLKELQIEYLKEIARYREENTVSEMDKLSKEFWDKALKSNNNRSIYKRKKKWFEK